MEPDDNIHSLIPDSQIKETSGENDSIIFKRMELTREKLTRSNILKVEGDELFKKGNYHVAINKYNKALQALCHVITLNGDEAFIMKELTVFLNSSIAACWLKLDEFELARNQCTSTLKLNVGNIEVLYIRALASLKLGFVEEAYIDLQEAHKIEPTNLDVLFELRRVEEVREVEFGKSQAWKGKEICEISLPHYKGNMFLDPLSIEGKDRSLSQSTICSTSKLTLMEEKKVNPPLKSNSSEMSLTSINMDKKFDYGIVSSSMQVASMGNEKNIITCDTSVKKVCKRYSLKRDKRFFLKICQDDYERLRWGKVLKYFSSHTLVFVTIRVVNENLNDFKNGYIQSKSKHTSFVSNSLSSYDLCDLSDQQSANFERDNLVLKETEVDEDVALKINVIKDTGENPSVSNSSSAINTSVNSNSVGPLECYQAPFRFTSRSRKCTRRKSWHNGRSHYNVRSGTKRKWVRVLSSEACSSTCKKRTFDCTYHLCALPVITPNEGSLNENYQTRQSKPLMESINSDVHELKRISKDLVDDLEKPFLLEECSQLPIQMNGQVKNCTPEVSHTELVSPSSTSLLASELGGSIVSGISDESEHEISIGQTLKRLLLTRHFSQQQLKHDTKEDTNNDQRLKIEDVKIQKIVSTDRGSCLALEVITGPACGICYSVRSTDASKLPLTLGRVPPSDIAVKDSEISGKHATINWNSSKLKWELVDIGSLNGTLLNSKAVHHPDSGSRHCGEPQDLVAGDVITLGTTSQISVQITPVSESEVPFGVGIASDPMSMRRGGKKFPMEDVCYYQWPLPGADQFGVFGICDGHGGALAAKSVSNILPKMVATVLSDSSRREQVLSQQDATDVLIDAISQTEACLNNYYEGCTATVLLVWDDGHSFFAQCANVGDSACIININGKQIKMTEDHRISSYSERQRINETGDPLKDGDKRLCGLNLGRMLGDKFLKEQDARFSSKPYISQVIHIERESEAFALLASDGLWDVISVRKAIQLVLQAKERYSAHGNESAEKIANFLLNEAKVLRTKDNTSVVYIDFHTSYRR